jgi:hypothetical protein
MSVVQTKIAASSPTTRWAVTQISATVISTPFQQLYIALLVIEKMMKEIFVSVKHHNGFQ